MDRCYSIHMHGVWYCNDHTASYIETGEKTWVLAKDGGRLDIFDFRADPTVQLSFWAVVNGLGTDMFCARSFYQPCVQRYSNVKTMSKLKYLLLSQELQNRFSICLIL